jgi:hypothetical protein
MPYVGRRSLRFLGINLKGEKSGGGPEALPTQIKVPFRLMNSKLASNLKKELDYSSALIG